MRRRPNGALGLRVSAVGIAVALLLLLSGCGGGGGSGTIAPPPPPPPPPPTLTITTTSLSEGIVGKSYSQTVQATGGTGARTWSATGLPAGLTMAPSTGVISGTPNSAGTRTVTVQVQDSGSPLQSASRQLTIRITNPLVITTSSLPSGSLRSPYTTQLLASGGVAPRVWSEPTGSFGDGGGGRVGSACEGLAINFDSGTISGFPVQAGTCGPFQIEVEDSSLPVQTASKVLSLVVAGDVVIINEFLPAGVVGESYLANLAADGGAQPYAWSATGLPASLTINTTTGEISGVPAAPGATMFTARVDDAAADFHEKQLSITVHAAAPGRNDSIRTATPLVTGGNLTITASISPFSDASTSAPDQDFYRLTATAGDTVRVETFARRLNPPSELDSVLEIVQADGTRFTRCREGGDGSNTGAVNGVNGDPDATPLAFDDACINDDIDLGNVRDSRMEFQVPGSGTVEFFVRVLDWRGDARPDFRYDLTITGAN